MANFDISNLNKSSFRGVPFYTQATDMSGGKRLTTHTFINSGTKVEDNGVKNNVFKITAYLGGENYLQEKENLKKAFELPGSGTLIDKFWGKHEVFIEPFTMKEEKTKFGQVTIEMTCHKAEFEADITPLIVYDIDIKDEVIAYFEDEYSDELGEEILNDNALTITDVLNSVEDTIKFLENARDFVQNIKSTIGKVISKIKTTILRVKSLSTEILSIVTSFDDMLDLTLFGASNQKSLTNGILQTMKTASGTFDNKIEEASAKNSKAFTYALNSLLLQTAIKNLENIDFDTGDDLGSIKSDVLEVFDILEKDIETNIDDDISKIQTRQNLLDKYNESRKLFIQFYTQKYSGLQNLKPVELVATTDVLNLTMEKYNDISRIDEVMINNNIVDPLFISGDLKLLDR